MTEEKKQGKNSVGIVETQYFTFDNLLLEGGEILPSVTIAYETYGILSEKKSNAVLILHAISGYAHAAGIRLGQNNPGWWDSMIVPGKAFDTNKYFICSNVLGGCKGTIGPSSINPKTGKPYFLDFPIISINDVINAQKRLIDSLGIERLLTAVGGSMGGMQLLSWYVKFPEKIRSAIPIATTARHFPQQRAFIEVERQAIMADPYWNLWNYFDPTPDKGPAFVGAVKIGKKYWIISVHIEMIFTVSIPAFLSCFSQECLRKVGIFLIIVHRN